MKISLECMYCGNKWEMDVYSKNQVLNENCSKCRDSNLKVRDLEATKIDYYVGSPPFPEKKKEDKGWPWGMGGSMPSGNIF